MYIPIPFRFSAIVIVLVALVLVMTGFIFKEGKGRADLEKRTGQLIMLQDNIQGVYNLHPGKMRYLSIAEYPFPFEIFIGKDWGDFKPDYENIDHLKIGDSITIYFYDDHSIIRDRLNRHAKFIDLGTVNYYRSGNMNRLFGLFVIGLIFVAFFYAYYLMRRGKIPY